MSSPRWKIGFGLNHSRRFRKTANGCKMAVIRILSKLSLASKDNSSSVNDGVAATILNVSLEKKVQ